MSLSTAFNVITSSFAANAAQTAVVSNNIANVNTPGYQRMDVSSSFEQAFSDDGGKTWEVNWIATDTRIAGAPG